MYVRDLLSPCDEEDCPPAELLKGAITGVRFYIVIAVRPSSWIYRAAAARGHASENRRGRRSAVRSESGPGFRARTDRRRAGAVKPPLK